MPARDGVNKALGIARHHRVGHGDGMVQVDAFAKHAMKIHAEAKLAPEHPLVDLLIRWGRMHEAHALRVPQRSYPGSEHKAQHGHGQFIGLAGRARTDADDLLAHFGEFAHLLDVHGQAFVQQMAVLNRGVQGVAHRALVRQQQADRPQVGKLPGFGHQQAEGVALRCLCRQFKQVHRRSRRYQLIRLAQNGSAQPHLGQQILRIETQPLGDLEVVRQHGSTNLDFRVRLLGGHSVFPRFDPRALQVARNGKCLV